MKLISKLFIKSAYIPTILFSLGLAIGLSACSNNTSSNAELNQAVNQQRVELGTVVAVRTIQFIPNNSNDHHPYGNIGVSASSGGHSGIYGSIDLATIGRLFKKTNKTETAQEIIVKKKNGKTVSITQKLGYSFKQGDLVKIVIRNGIAQVIH